MSTTLIAVNGFDIIGGVSSSCRDFFNCIFFFKNEEVVEIKPCFYNIIVWLIYLIVLLILISYFYTLYVNCIQIFEPSTIRKYHIKTKRYFHLFRSVGIPAFILLSIILFFGIAVVVFNNKCIFLRESIFIPKDIEAWADFATCMTLPFALISFFYVYRTFQSQALAARRASFDTTFTQMFAQHNTLREKVVQHKLLMSHSGCSISVDLFSFFRANAISNIDTRGSSFNISVFYRDIINSYNLNGTIDLKNYCKYIFHEVQMVVINEYLNDNVKRRYIRLIQGQMNNDELFCYLINQIEYISRKSHEQIRRRRIWRRSGTNENLRLWRERRVSYINSIEYAEQLRSYDFFRDLCEDNFYRGYISALNNIYWVELNYLINSDWIKN